ncbi:unnamed protein product [Calypogeia fissa]
MAHSHPPNQNYFRDFTSDSARTSQSPATPDKEQMTDYSSERSIGSEAEQGPSSFYEEETDESEKDEFENVTRFGNVKRVEREHLRRRKSMNRLVFSISSRTCIKILK